MKEIKMTARPWQPQDLLDDLQLMIDEQPDNYLNTDRETLCTAKAYLEEYFSKPKWISVTERLPREEWERFCAENDWDVYPCLVTIKNSRGGRYVTKLFFTGENFVDDEYIRYTEQVTHWMPLPQPPKGE